MQIIRDKFYLQELDNILDYKAKYSLNSALNFLSNLDSKINNLLNMPYKFRQSYYYNNKSVRDLIFKGYTIPYMIDDTKNLIIILDIFKWKYRPLQKGKN
jgi:hypothetical protein